MFIIDFRNKNVSEYRFSVMNNSNVDIIHFYSHFTQYAVGTSIYLKVKSVDETYIDKIAIASENVSIDDGALLCKWLMGAVSTQCKKIGLQLQFEQGETIIAQTGIVYLTLADTIDVSHEIEPIYPDVLKHLQEQIDELDEDKVDKVEGMGLSHNDYTDNEKSKLGGIESNAQVNVLEGVKVDGTELEIVDKKVNVVLSGKVDKTNVANKVYGTDNSGTQTTYTIDSFYEGSIVRRDSDNSITVPLMPTENGHAPSKQYVDDLVKTIKKESYKVVDTTEYPTLNDFLASTGEEGYLYLYPIDTSDLTKGYYRYIWEGNDWLDLGTTQIDLSNYVDLTSNQTITGVKTFTPKIKTSYIECASNSNNNIRFDDSLYQWQFNGHVAPSTNNTRDLGSSSYAWKDLYLGGKVYVDYVLGKTNDTYGLNIGNGWVASVGNFLPNTNNARDLGSSSNKWKDLYVAGLLFGATYNYSIDDSYKLLFGMFKTNDDTTLEYIRINVYSKSANTTFAILGAPAGCYPEYKAIITNSHSTSAITLTFTIVSSILCNDDNCLVVNGTNSTITIPSGTSIECSIMNGKMIAVNFSAN